MSKSTTIILSASKEEVIGSLEYVFQIARQAPVSADIHDKVKNNLAFIVQGIQEKDLAQIIEEATFAMKETSDLIEFKEGQLNEIVAIAEKALKLSDKK